jgi:putative FmdB family regulatory protein
MALYEYNCPSCGATFEKRMPMNEVKQRMKCPKCKKMARKTIGNFAVVGVSEPGFGDGPAPWDDDDDDMMGGMDESGMPDMAGLGDDPTHMGHDHGAGGHSH